MNTCELYEELSNMVVSEIFIKDAFICYKKDIETTLKNNEKLYDIEVR